MKTNPANSYRNSPLYGTYTAVMIKALFDLQDREKVNLSSSAAMLSWSFEFENKDFFEGFRTLATNGVDKPVLNVFRMAGLMSGERVATSSTGQIALDDMMKDGVRQAPDIDAFANQSRARSRRHGLELPRRRSAGVGARMCRLTVSGIPSGVKKVLLEHYRIDDTHSNSYTVWKAMDSLRKHRRPSSTRR